jgi:IMP dehydrogenase
MRLLHPDPGHDLTYNDVFMVPSLSAVGSRLGVDLTTPDGIGTTIPLVVSNMTAVAGRRMSETVARRGGIAVLPQDIPLEVISQVVSFVKSRHHIFETPITLTPQHTVGDALSLIHKRAHGAVVVTNATGEPIGVFTEADAVGFDRFSQLQNVMSRELITLEATTTPEQAFNRLAHERLSMAPVIDTDGRLMGVMTSKGALRSTIYRPALDAHGRLLVAVAVGINADPVGRARDLVAMGVDVLVMDTAHGHQTKMLEVVEAVRAAVGDVPIVAGNVVTADGTRQLIEAGANIVKVGVGPGAMCTTRMMTGVGRPQFSAVIECAQEASVWGSQIWADCVDASGEVLQPALCGPDPRMEPDAKWLISQLPGGADDWERITGAAPSSERMVAKCSWLHRSDPDTWGQIAQLLPLSAWLVGKLAGTSQPPEISPALAQTTGFWSVGDGAYSRLICQIIDAKRDLVGCLPSVSAWGRAQASVEWNNIPVSCG